MNAAARLYNQGVVSRSWVMATLLSRTQFTIAVLVLAVLTSGLGIIYVTNAARSLNAALQQTLAERQQLHIQWGQLLLEKSTWVMQARIQQIAERNLGMVAPDKTSVVMINE